MKLTTVSSKQQDENAHPNKKVKTSDSPMYTMGTPAYRAKICRENVKSSTTSHVKEVIDLDGVEFVNTADTVLTVYGVNLTRNDMTRLDPGGWLNTNLINAGQALLRKRFPKVCGLQDVILSRTLTFQQQGDNEFVQILNCANQHWVCVSTIGCKPKLVKVYDSMRVGDLPASTEESIAAMLNCRTRNIYLVYPDVQQQTDGSSCGLFSLAFAHTLCEGNDPAITMYSQDTLRSHLLACLQAKKITPFENWRSPYKNPGKNLKSRIQVFCSCRLPDTGDDMVQCKKCKEWFHYTCVGIPLSTKLTGKWNCSNCSPESPQ